jgi:hypothetical protein
VHRIRIALVDLRPRLRDILTDALTGEPDMELVSPPVRTEAPRPFVDVLIVGTDEPDDEAVPTRLLAEAPHSSVLMIAARDGAASLYELRPAKRSVGDLTAAGLIRAIRTSARGHAAPPPDR